MHIIYNINILDAKQNFVQRKINMIRKHRYTRSRHANKIHIPNYQSAFGLMEYCLYEMMLVLVPLSLYNI